MNLESVAEFFNYSSVDTSFQIFNQWLWLSDYAMYKIPRDDHIIKVLELLLCRLNFYHQNYQHMDKE